MHRPHIRTVALAVAVATAVTGLAGPALAAPAGGQDHTVSSAGTSTDSVVAAAGAAAFAHASATGVTNGDGLRARDVLLDPEGARHVRFIRTHRGLPVLGGDLVVHLDRQLRYTGVTRAAGHTVRTAATRAALTPGQAAARAASAAHGEAGAGRCRRRARRGRAAPAGRRARAAPPPTPRAGSRSRRGC
ncbi:M4 family metallopeptidase, partial [Streptomyces sp. NPDC001212]